MKRMARDCHTGIHVEDLTTYNDAAQKMVLSINS